MTIASFLGTLVIWTALSSIVLFLAWIATQTAKRHAALRHLIWVSAFTTLLIVPAMSTLVPARFILGAEPSLSSQELITFEESLTGPTTTEFLVAPAEPFNWQPVLTGITALWATGASALILKIMLGVHQAQAMRRASKLQQIEPIWPSRSTEVRVSLTRRPPSALTWGIFRPVVILPQDSENWTQEKLTAVMHHELAHVRRFDSLSQILSLILCAVYWFNPLVWLAAKALRADAEIAADDAVVNSGISPSAYAAELLQIATEFGRQRQPLTTIGVSLMKQSQIETRIISIVDPNNRRRGVAKLEGMSVLALGAVAAVALVSLRPALAIAQGTQSPVVAPTTAPKPSDPTQPAIAPISQIPLVKPAIAPSAPTKASKSVKPAKAPKTLRRVKGEALIAPNVAPSLPTTPAIASVPAQGSPITTDPTLVPSTAPPIQDPTVPPKASDPPQLPAKAARLSVPTKPEVSKSNTKNPKLYHFQWNPKLKKYQRVKGAYLSTPIKLKYSTSLIQPSEVPTVSMLRLTPSEIKYQVANTTTPSITLKPSTGSITTLTPVYRTVTPKLNYRISTIKPTLSLQGSDQDQVKAKRLEDVQRALDKALAEKQAAEIEHKKIQAELKKALQELEKARAKQGNKGSTEAKLRERESVIQNQRYQKEVQLLERRKAEVEREVKKTLSAEELKRILILKEQNRADIERRIVLEKEIDRKARKDEIEKRQARERAARDAEEKSKADKRKSGRN